MEHLYNPDRMTEQEIKRTFVARQHLVEDLTTQIERQPQGAGVQHFVIIAPRGMGKTTMLLMVGFAVRDRGLSADWQVVRFAEESYSVTSLADFWLQVIHLLTEDTQDVSLRGQADALIKEFRKDDELQEATLALLKDWCRQNHKRLLLLVDNFDLILEQINDEQENARLRNVLMNDGAMLLIGGATTFFHEARAYDQPLYNFFKIIHLESLKFEEMQNLLRQRAALDDLPNFEAILRANRTRLKVLEYFTGGNPRLVLMLYRIITDSEVVDVRRGLEQLLDQVTPYYKGKLESLPPQQRKILDQIARVSGETHEGSTPTQIATATRLTPNAVSSQLKRLAEQGYVRSANLRGRSSYYTLAEPLYAIWHQMRFGRSARQKMQWLVSFLKGWYDTTELEGENKRLEGRFAELLQTGLMREARQVLEHRFYVVEAMDNAACNNNMNSVVSGFLALQALDMLNAEVLPSLQLENLSTDTLDKLIQAQCISEEEASQAIQKAATSHKERKEAEVVAAVNIGSKAMSAKRFQEALDNFNRVLALQPENRKIQVPRGLALLRLGRVTEALAIIDELDTYDADEVETHILKGAVYRSTERYEEALSSENFILGRVPDMASTWESHAWTLAMMGRYEEAISSTKNALNIAPNHLEAWRLQGRVYENLEQYDQAVVSYSRALDFDPTDIELLLLRGLSYINLGEFDKAVEDTRCVIQAQPDSLAAKLAHAISLVGVGKYLEGIAEYDILIKSATKLSAVGLEAIYLLEMIPFMHLNEETQIATCWHKAVEVGSQADAWHESASSILLYMASNGHLELAHKLVTDSHTTQIFFPIFRALEYMLKTDEVLLENLSPEVRNIVGEMIDTIQEARDGGRKCSSAVLVQYAHVYKHPK